MGLNVKNFQPEPKWVSNLLKGKKKRKLAEEVEQMSSKIADEKFVVLEKIFVVFEKKVEKFLKKSFARQRGIPR